MPNSVYKTGGECHSPTPRAVARTKSSAAGVLRSGGRGTPSTFAQIAAWAAGTSGFSTDEGAGACRSRRTSRRSAMPRSLGRSREFIFFSALCNVKAASLGQAIAASESTPLVEQGADHL